MQKTYFTAYSNDGRKDPWFKFAYCNDNGDCPYLGMRYNNYPRSGFERFPNSFIFNAKKAFETLDGSNPDRFAFDRESSLSDDIDYMSSLVDEFDVSTTVEVGSLKYWRDVVVLKDKGPFTVIWGDCDRNHSEHYGFKGLGLYWNGGKAKVPGDARFFLIPDFLVVPCLQALIELNKKIPGFCDKEKTEAALGVCLNVYNPVEEIV